MLSNNFRQIWSRGVQLKDAWYEFAPGRWRNAYDNPDTATPPRVNFEALQKLPRPDQLRESLQLIGGSLTQLIGSQREQAEVRRQMEELLLARLRAGTLIALGFLRKSGTDADIGIAPAYFFETDYAVWEKSLFRAPDAEFISVRVVRSRKATTPAIASADKPRPIHRQKPGRPSLRDGIIVAINALASKGLRLGNLPMKEAHRLVIQKMDEIFPGSYSRDKGRGVETVRRIIRELNL